MDAVLETPLTAYEIGYRMTESERITGRVILTEDNLAQDNGSAGVNNAQRLVRIVDLSGQNYEDAVDAIDDMGGSTGAAVKHLSQWDFGQETDNDAAVIDNYTSRNHVENLAHHREEHNSISYWLIADHSLRHYALYRRPLGSI